MMLFIVALTLMEMCCPDFDLDAEPYIDFILLIEVPEDDG